MLSFLDIMEHLLMVPLMRMKINVGVIVTNACHEDYLVMNPNGLLLCSQESTTGLS
jgi:hypothetical protein